MCTCVFCVVAFIKGSLSECLQTLQKVFFSGSNCQSAVYLLGAHYIGLFMNVYQRLQNSRLIGNTPSAYACVRMRMHVHTHTHTHVHTHAYARTFARVYVKCSIFFPIRRTKIKGTVFVLGRNTN